MATPPGDPRLLAATRGPARKIRLGRARLLPSPSTPAQGDRPALRRSARPGEPALKIAVLGASGVVGRALTSELVDEHEVVAVSRTPLADSETRARWIAADVTRGRELDGVLDGIDVVYHLVHSLGAEDFARRDRIAADAVAGAAERAGVRQIVFLGGLGDAREHLSGHLRSRAETAERLGSRSVPVTTLRSAIVVGEGSAAFETILALVDRLPAMVCPRWVSTKTQPIALRDVVRYLVGVAGRPEAFGRAFDVAGPEVMTCRDMIQRIADLRGRRPVIVEVPFLTPRLSSLWLRLVTPVQASVARELVDGLRTETVAREHGIAEVVPIELTPFDHAARAALPGRDAT